MLLENIKHAPDPERHRISIHEAGHAVMLYRLGGRIPEGKYLRATGSPGYGFDETTARGICPVEYPLKGWGPEQEAIVTLGGPFAESVHLGHPPILGGSDLADTTKAVNQQVQEAEDNSAEIIRSWTAKTISLLQEPTMRTAVQRIAAQLDEFGVMEANEVEAILIELEIVSPATLAKMAALPAQIAQEVSARVMAGIKTATYGTTNIPLNATFKIVRKLSTETTQRPSNGCRKYAQFDTRMDISKTDTKSFRVIKHGEQIVDYQDVRIDGYLSTFKGTTPFDRDGDYVLPGAFETGIQAFMKNPVLLMNHKNAVENLVGSFTKMREDQRGLYIQAELSNSPALAHVRALVAEGHLKTLSMGGLFHYQNDGIGIYKVELYEGSLTPIPANPDAIVSVREVTAEEVKTLWART